MTLTRRRFLGAAALFAGVTPAASHAADRFPTRQIHIIVPFTPGGGNDLMGRLVAAKLGDEYGQQIVVENKSGAGGTIGVGAAVSAPPDGYTLVIGSVSTISINQSLYTNLTYNSTRDLAPISLFASTPALLVVPLDSPANSVQELIALAKANPGKLNFGSAGNGTSHHLAAELFKFMAGIDIVHIPYRGSSPAVAAMLTGDIQLMFIDVPAVLAMVEAKKFKALGITSPERFPLMPNVPTIAESGLPGYEVDVWYGVLAPAATPDPIIQQLNASIRRIGDLPDIKQKLASEGVEVKTGSSAEFAALIRREADKWDEIIKRAGIHF
jgi:tripartite-type tricarboxylate transporter receptor subunit TctC